MVPISGLKKTQPLLLIDSLAASLIFVLPMIGTALRSFRLDAPAWVMTVLLILFGGSMGFAIILAVARGLPRWSLSYFGFFITTIVFYTLLWGLWGLLFYPGWMSLFGPMDSWSMSVRILYQGLTIAFMWFLVLLTALILIRLLRLDALRQRVCTDWTQLSYLVYGGLIFYIGLIFDDYQYDDPWKFVAFVSLAIGGWLYLRINEQKKRVLALIGGVSAAMWLVAIGKWIIVPMQNWPVDLGSERFFETGWSISVWIVTLIALMAPAALLKYLPLSPDE